MAAEDPGLASPDGVTGASAPDDLPEPVVSPYVGSALAAAAERAPVDVHPGMAPTAASKIAAEAITGLVDIRILSREQFCSRVPPKATGLSKLILR